ncbi:diguanylate cyclase domain-containing protein [Aquipuribacter sp. MA13-6]|uniref:diguanylate cyclase domain-containing protein n=1 Tax=unclassified Aquipuribacter TaxID=2635084 RepID=UPI003EEB6A9F
MHRTDETERRSGLRWTTAATGAVVLGVVFAVAVHLLPDGAFVTTAVDNLVQLAAPALAAVLALAAARRCDGRDRRLWGWLAAACASWAAGQAVWSWYELLRRVEPPFPSLADAGFLGFPLLAVVGLLRWRGGPQPSAGARDLIDGALLAGALLMLSWKTVLGTVLDEGGATSLGFALALAYPFGGLVSATVVLLLVARTGVGARPYVLLVAAGMLSLAVADSAYVYLLSVGAYATGNVISAGWVTGFLLVAAAAVVARGGPATVADRRLPAHGLFALPYVAVAIALGAVIVSALAGVVPPAIEILLAAVLIGLLLVRQYLVVRDNDRLLVQLQVREAALAHEVMHDGLTGLSNRAMVLARLDQVLARHARDGRGLVVLYCDLDGFKAVNDTLGHLAGDAVLREVADRLRACLRSSDTVARLSGDEFAVLLEPPHDEPMRVAGRLVDAVAAPFEVPGAAGTVAVGVSVGVAVLLPGPGQVVQAETMIAAADGAMYAAKSGGRNRAVMVEVGCGDGHDRVREDLSRAPG